MRNLVSGIVGVVWGGSVTVYGLVTGLQGTGPYLGGQVAALVVGLILLVAGVYYVRRGIVEMRNR